MLFPTDVDEEQAALLLQLAASSPDKGLQRLAGNYLAVAQGSVNSNTSNINSTSNATNNFALPRSFLAASNQPTSGQFDDAPESLDPRLLPHLSSSMMGAAPVPLSHEQQSLPTSLLNASLWEQHGQVLQQRQARDMQVQWGTAARQAHLSMMRQQQERDYYLAMASNPPSVQGQMVNLAKTNNQPASTSGRGHVGGKRQSQALAAIRRAKTQKNPQVPQQAPVLNQQQHFLPQGTLAFSDPKPATFAPNGLAPNGMLHPSMAMLLVSGSNNIGSFQNGMGAAQFNLNAAPAPVVASNVSIQPSAAMVVHKLQASPGLALPAVKGKPSQPSSPDSPSRAPKVATTAIFPKPDEDSWMHKMEEIHPSPLISPPGQQNETVPLMFQAVKSDLETKREPIQENGITRYDVLAGRGGKTNVHEVRTCQR